MEETPSAAPPAHRPVALSSTGVFLIALAVQFLGYIPTHFFALNVGATDAGKGVLGEFQWFLLVASSINMIGDLRIGSAYTMFIARGESPKVGTGTYFLLRAAMVAGGGLVLWLCAPVLPYSTDQYLGLFALWMTLPFLWTLSTVYAQLWSALGQSVRGQMPQLVESVVRTAALTVVAVNSLTLSPASFADVIPQVTYAYVLGAAASAVYSFPAVYRERARFSLFVTSKYFRYAWPLMGSLLLLYLSSTVIQFLVVSDYTSKVYNVFLAANGFRILALAIPAAVAVPLFPRLSGLHRAGDYELVRQRTWAALRYTALVVIPLALAMVIYRVNLLYILYSGTYATQGATALSLMAISSVPAALSQIIGTSLNSVGQQRLELYLTSLQVVVLVAASLLLLNPVALLGLDPVSAASLAVVLSSFAGLFLNTYFMESRVGVRIQWVSFVTITVAAGASFFVVSLFNDYFLVNRYYELIAGVSLGMVVYALVLAAVGELSKADVRQIVGALGLPHRLGEVLARLCRREETWPVNPLPAGGAVGLKPLEGEAPPEGGPGPERPGR
jgi:O-antigen/teichoic acid export membrane protein